MMCSVLRQLQTTHDRISGVVNRYCVYDINISLSLISIGTSHFMHAIEQSTGLIIFDPISRQQSLLRGLFLDYYCDTGLGQSVHDILLYV